MISIFALTRPHSEHPLDYALPAGIECTRMHIPVTGMRVRSTLVPHFCADFGVPSVSQAESVVGALKKALAEGKVAAVHCHAGAGRTGTMLGCYLVSERGMGAAEAIELLRKQGRVLSNKQQVRGHLSSCTPGVAHLLCRRPLSRHSRRCVTRHR